MEYTNEMYEEDLKLVRYTYKRYYSKFINFKDDLIQSALIKAPKVRELYTEEKGKYSTYAVLYFRSKMVDFLKAEKRHNNLGNDLSLDVELNNEESTLHDILGYEQDFLQDYNFLALKNIVTKIIQKTREKDIFTLKNPRMGLKRKKGIKTEQKHAIEYFVNGKTMQQIADENNISRQAVGSAVKKYQKIIQEELKKMGYFE